MTDGERVYAYFKNGDLACADLAGTTLWQQNLQTAYGGDKLWWDLGISPVLTSKYAVLAVMHQGPSYLVAVDKLTGQEAWKQSRDLDAPGEARDSYTTPLVIQREGSELVIVLGADHVTAHDAETGSLVWKAGSLNPGRRGNLRSIASPVVANELLIAPYSGPATMGWVGEGPPGSNNTGAVSVDAAG